ncbi:MAG TPA: glycoside hydrolase family 15 protein [Candidatus Dormibacteraeota bacterium]|nr:glycoside hydrolase family 15 protein [Candidatus Dormibacteraeota bacterium]
MSGRPIADYALISDCRSAALVGRDGSMDWACPGRFDRPSVFARLLDEDGGHWSLRPEGDAEVSRRYLDGTMVLETTFRTARGRLVLLDAMAVGPDDRGHELGRGSPGVLLRRATCVEGTVQLGIEFRPRMEYGLVHPRLVRLDGCVVARGGADVLVLSCAAGLRVERGSAGGAVALAAGERACFALQHVTSAEPVPRPWSQEAVDARLDATIRGWRTWSDIHQGYEGPWRELVHHSGRVLQALTYQPTGAIVAAPTTSLPEAVGAGRNWDYRYTWVRDASLTLEALWVAACPDEAHRFFAWMAAAAAARVPERDLQIMFGVGGEHDLTERELGHLSGWRDSRPVRVGNGAWNQRQLDVYGELLSAARRLRHYLGAVDETTRGFLVEVAGAAADRWREGDQGIWEVRGEPRHFLYSKLMCWVALDCAIELAGELGARDRVDGWSRTRARIRDAIEARGWSESAGAFTQSFGSDDLDASALMLPITGFLPGSDPRVRSTIDTIDAGLTDARGLVYRYRSHDGLEGQEGSFLICTFWLAQALALAGELERARRKFEQAVAYANDVGLLAEEVDPESGELLGNFPQAFSHIGLINAAWAIAQAERAAAPG